MQYEKNTANGDAGEYFTAYKITKLFGWPCRLYGIDLGVDGEVEIVDEYRSSAGDIIKIQIKSFDEEKPKDKVAIYVEDRHVNYWKKFCLPVIVCAVDLQRELIYWRHITSTEAYQSSGKSGRIDFSTETDLLTLQSKDHWSRLVVPPESKNIHLLFEKLAALEPMLPAFLPDSIMIDELIDAEGKCDELRSIIGAARDLISHYPWRVGSVELGWFNDLTDRVLWLKSRCRQLHNAW